MPVKTTRKERPLITLFLSAYENDGWKSCSLDWVEDKQDGAVEVVATKSDGTTLALEHTLIQPFVGEKSDSERFLTAFSRIERDKSLVEPGRSVEVYIPVGALPTGWDWSMVGEEVRAWLAGHGPSLPLGLSRQVCVVGSSSKKGPFPLSLQIQVSKLPGEPGECRIARYGVPGDLGNVVERALRMKLPKLVRTRADKHLFLIERDQVIASNLQIYAEIQKQEPNFPALKLVDEIWFADTAALDTEQYVAFALVDQRGLIERLTFQKDTLTQRRDDRPYLP
jgi:hypothetical protein